MPKMDEYTSTKNIRSLDIPNANLKINIKNKRIFKYINLNLIII